MKELKEPKVLIQGNQGSRVVKFIFDYSLPLPGGHNPVAA